MENYAKVEGHPNLIRDLKTNAIINTDQIQSNNYNLLKYKKLQEKEKINKLEEDLIELKSSIDDIKKMLLDLKNGS